MWRQCLVVAVVPFAVAPFAAAVVAVGRPKEP